MRILLFISLSFFGTSIHVQAQLPVAKFDNIFNLKDGIYSSYTELLTNNLAFPNCLLIVSANKDAVNKDELNYCVIGNESNIIPFGAALYATVEKGKLSVYYKKSLINVYSKGTLCTFIYTTDIYKNQ